MKYLKRVNDFFDDEERFLVKRVRRLSVMEQPTDDVNMAEGQEEYTVKLGYKTFTSGRSIEAYEYFRKILKSAKNGVNLNEVSASLA